MLVLEAIEVSGAEPTGVMEMINARVASVPGGLEGKIVRLEIRGMTRETYRHLDHKALRTLRAQALNLTLDISFVSTTSDAKTVAQPGRGLLKDQLAEFSREWEVPGVTRDEMASLLESYVARVEAKHEAS